MKMTKIFAILREGDFRKLHSREEVEIDLDQVRANQDEEPEGNYYVFELVGGLSVKKKVENIIDEFEVVEQATIEEQRRAAGEQPLDLEALRRREFVPPPRNRRERRVELRNIHFDPVRVEDPPNEVPPDIDPEPEEIMDDEGDRDDRG